jgi:plastocyanin
MRKFVMSCAACALALTTGIAGATGDVSNEDETLGLGDQLKERRVDIKGGVFFPPMILASTGETIFFRNDEEEVHDATAIDGSWTTGPIQPGETTQVTVSAEMTLCFQSTYNEEFKGAFGSAATGEAPECFELSGAGDGTDAVQN